MNKADREIVEQADQLLSIIERLRAKGLGKREGGAARPIHWPALKPSETTKEWNALREWVEQMRIRFPNAIRLPDCWWRHNDLVEVLAALRDYERACFTETASATGPVEWQRALRDMEGRMEIWIKRFGCTVPGRGHDTPTPPDATPQGWVEFVEQDEQRRRDSAAPEPDDDGSTDTVKR